MERAERDRIEQMARRTAMEVLHAAGTTGEMTPASIARAISEAIATVLADHDYRYLHLPGNGTPLPDVMPMGNQHMWLTVTCPIHGALYSPNGRCPYADYAGNCSR